MIISAGNLQNWRFALEGARRGEQQLDLQAVLEAFKDSSAPTALWLNTRRNADEKLSLKLTKYALTVLGEQAGWSWVQAHEWALASVQAMLMEQKNYDTWVEFFPSTDEVLFKNAIHGQFLKEDLWRWRMYPDGIKRYARFTSYAQTVHFYS